MKQTFYSIEIAEIKKESPDAVSIVFKIPEELKQQFSYSAGQYLTIKTEIKGKEIRRAYSLCAAAFEGEWRIVVKRVKDGIFSNFANSELSAGMFLDLMPAQGNFILSKKAYKNIVFFAAGSGITPIFSMIKTMLNDKTEQEIILFYSNKISEQTIFKSKLDELSQKYSNRFKLFYIFTQENNQTELLNGRIDKQRCDALLSTYCTNKIDEAYICGPNEMLNDIKQSLKDYGLNSENIHFELFNAPEEIDSLANEDSIQKKINLIIDGDSFEFSMNSNDSNILKSGIDAGIDLPYACLNGVCCSCRAKILKGEAKMKKNFALDADEVDAGYVLCCQTYPLSDLQISFDE